MLLADGAGFSVSGTSFNKPLSLRVILCLNNLALMHVLKNIFSGLIFLLFLLAGCKTANVVYLKDFGAMPDSRQNTAVAAAKLVQFLQSHKDAGPLTVHVPKGVYHFYETDALVREYYISNHDQDNPKKVGIELKQLKNITIDGNGSTFIFHGRMIPLAILHSRNITIKNISFDFELPALRQLNVLEANKNTGEVIAEIYPKANYQIKNNKLVVLGEGYEFEPSVAMAFNENKRLTYIRRDVGFSPRTVEEVRPDVLKISGWKEAAFTSPGERYVLRTYYRPTPGIFVSESKDITLHNVKVHYAEGMGMLAQMSENITLDSFAVALKGKDDPRYFTTQADATHFSACKGKIISRNGLYEGMADDAINVHGTYLRVVKIVNGHTLHARYMHPQAWGFKWGEAGDNVQFIESAKMELVGDNYTNKIKTIKPLDKPDDFGAREFEIVFEKPLPAQVSADGTYGLENLAWTPEVYFTNNIIRNNRARGALFSTPKKVVCSDNIFDHTHGTAILLCGDCNGWFETGACKDVEISNNTFINALTANYQFTNAAISIYPEIPDLKNQRKYFHSGIVIKDNKFDMFDRPVLYAKSTNGLRFENNTIVYNKEFAPFHWNKHLFFFEKVRNVAISNNKFQKILKPAEDVRIELSDSATIKIGNNQ